MFTLTRLAPVAAAVALVAAVPALAALAPGQKAPEFNLKAATNGKVSDFKLSAALKKGPVVVYFYPKAFTGGCSLEAKAYADAMPKFASKKVSVVGVSADGIEVLQDFSQKDCQGAFPVASDPGAKVAKAFDAKLPAAPMSGRVSYFIAQDGKVKAVHDSGDYSGHVPAMLAAAGIK